MAKKKCGRIGRIGLQRRKGGINCYRDDKCRRVIICVGDDGFNQCTDKTCPHSGEPIAQQFD
jgi:hypothetical protein